MITNLLKAVGAGHPPRAAAADYDDDDRSSSSSSIGGGGIGGGGNPLASTIGGFLFQNFHHGSVGADGSTSSSPAASALLRHSPR